MGKRMNSGSWLGSVGGLFVVAGALATLSGCAVPVEGGAAPGAEKGESVGQKASAYAATYGNVNCQDSDVTVVQAVYEGSVGSLIESLCPPPGSTATPSNVCSFTQNYFDSIPGAAGYYYITKASTGGAVEGQTFTTDYWFTIPIIDSQPDVTTPVTFEPSYPGLPSVRFPHYGEYVTVAFPTAKTTYLYDWALENPSLWQETNGAPDGHWVGQHKVVNGELTYSPTWPFLLSATNYYAFTAAMSDPRWVSDTTIAARDQVCTLIVDTSGNVLDFAAHLAQWDPQPSCPACGALQ